MLRAARRTGVAAVMLRANTPKGRGTRAFSGIPRMEP